MIHLQKVNAQEVQTKLKIHSSLSIRSKFVILAILLVLVIGIWVAWQAEQILQNVMVNDLVLRGLSIARDVATHSADSIITNDYNKLLQTVDDTVNNNQDIVYLFLLDKKGELLVQANPGQKISESLFHLHNTADDQTDKTTTFRSESGIIHDIAVPIVNGQVGTVRLGLTEATLQEAIAQTRASLFAMILTTLLIAALVTIFFTNMLLYPLQRLTEATSNIAAQDFSVRVSVQSRDEIGQLAAAFNRMVEQLGLYKLQNSENRAEIERKEKLRKQLVKRLITAQEEERKRIARELHDETSQSLTALKLGLKTIEDTNSLVKIKELTSELRSMLGLTLAEISVISRNLRPSVLDDMGLNSAIARLVEASGYRMGKKIHYSSEGLNTKRFPSYIETAVYRIVQEALTNSIRYAQADVISVRLRYTENTLLAVVSDNGIGFNLEEVLDGNDTQVGGLGLFGMQERALLIGAKLDIDSSPGFGTKITLAIPKV